MSRSTCRDDSCLRGFANPNQRNIHEKQMHPNLIDEAVVRIIDKVLSTNSTEAITKKIIKVGTETYSYHEAREFVTNEDNSVGQDIKKILQSFIEVYFAQNEESGVRELLQADFRIN